MNKKQREQQEAVATLKEWGLAPGTKVYGDVTHISRSGMSRNIKLYIVTPDADGECTRYDISYHAAKALEWPHKDGYNGGVRVGGCGMNMILHTIDSLSYAMGYGPMNQAHSVYGYVYGDELKDATPLPGLRGNL